MNRDIKSLTGSGGKEPVVDGGVRGIIGGALAALLLFANESSDWLTDQDVIILAPVVFGVSFLLWGIWDRIVKPRLG